jgi:anti-anti-sigma factor
MNPPSSSDSFTIERHGEVTLISATPALESLDPTMEGQVATLLMGPLRAQVAPQVVFDLSGVNYFGSMFLAVLLRCWKLITSTGGTLVLAGVSPQARELLRVTSLDLIWPMYSSRREAIEALLSD